MKSLFLLVLSVHFCSFAAIGSELGSIFTEHFYHKYEARQCGQNSLGYLRAINASLPGDIDSFYLVSLKNKGFSVFGMVNAERARGTRFQKPASVEMNWYHHVFVMDENDNVYDFDFGVTPTIVPIESYLEDMFLDEPECETPRSGEFCAGRETKLKDYQLSIVPARDALVGDESRQRVLPMQELL